MRMSVAKCSNCRFLSDPNGYAPLAPLGPTVPLAPLVPVTPAPAPGRGAPNNNLHGGFGSRKIFAKTQSKSAFSSFAYASLCVH